MTGTRMTADDHHHWAALHPDGTAALDAWLTAAGIDLNMCAAIAVTGGDGGWTITAECYVPDADGRPHLDPDRPDRVLTRTVEHTTTSPRPWWPPTEPAGGYPTSGPGGSTGINDHDLVD